MTDRELIEFLRAELSQSREREAALTDHVRGLESSMAEMSASLGKRVESQKEAYTELLRRFDEQNAALQRSEALLRAFRKHSEELEAANLNLKRRVDELTRKRFGRSSEQRALLNNRNTDVRAKESDSYDGSDDDRDGTDKSGNGGNAAAPSGSQGPSGRPSRHRRPTAGPDESEATSYDEVIDIQTEKGKNGDRPQGLAKKRKAAQYTKDRAEDEKVNTRKAEMTDSKITNAIIMIRRAIMEGIRFDYLLVDSWFPCAELLQFRLNCW